MYSTISQYHVQYNADNQVDIIPAVLLLYPSIRPSSPLNT